MQPSTQDYNLMYGYCLAIAAKHSEGMAKLFTQPT